MAVTAIVVDTLNASDEGGWDEFVRSCPAALPQHLLGWRTVIANTYGYRSRYLVAKSDGQIAGVMPLFEVHSLVQGHHFTTLPGGICTMFDGAGFALIEHAKEMIVSQNATFLAVRDSRHCWERILTGQQSQCSVFLDVSVGPERFKKQIPYDVRRYINRAEKAGVQVRMGADQLANFYQVFAKFTRSKGTPVFPRALLSNVLAVFPENASLLGLWLNEEMVGGALNFLVGKTMFNILSFSLNEYLPLRPNHLLYWQYVEDACAHGCTRLDLGRSSVGSGQHNFKMRWGGLAKEVPVYQQFFLHRARRIPLVANDTTEGSGRLVTRFWQRMPLPLVEVIGPMVRQQVPFV